MAKQKRPTKKRISWWKVTKLFIYLALFLMFIFWIVSMLFGFINSDNTTKFQDSINDTYETTTVAQTQERAEIVMEKFVADFYTMQYKDDRSDIQGFELVWQQEEFYNDFVSTAKNTYYKYIDQYAAEYKAKNLPAVSAIEILDTTSESDFCSTAYEFCFETTYVFEIKISYEESETTQQINPPTSATITVGWDGTDYKVLYIE